MTVLTDYVADTIAQRATLTVEHPHQPTLHVDRGAMLATANGKRIPLGFTPFQLLAELATIPDQVRTKQDLYARVWGCDLTASSRALDTQICLLRRRMSHAGFHGYVQNVFGVGYRLYHPDAA